MSDIRIYLQTQRWDPISMLIRFSTRSVLEDGSIGPSHAGFFNGADYLSAQGDGVKLRPRDPHSIIWMLDAPKVEGELRVELGGNAKNVEFVTL